MRVELVTILKRKATDLITQLSKDQELVLITQHGLPAAYPVVVRTFSASLIFSTSHFEKTLCAARLGSAIFSRRSYSSRASPGTLLARRINSPRPVKIPPHLPKMRIAALYSSSHVLSERRIELIQNGQSFLCCTSGRHGVEAALGIELGEADGGEFFDELVHTHFPVFRQFAKPGVFVVG